MPSHEAVEAAKPGNQIVAGPQVQMVGVGEHDLRPGIQEVTMRHRLDRGARADGHERRRFYRAMRRAQDPRARRASPMGHLECERRLGRQTHARSL
jgi:hypothetical protein